MLPLAKQLEQNEKKKNYLIQLKTKRCTTKESHLKLAYQISSTNCAETITDVHKYKTSHILG